MQKRSNRPLVFFLIFVLILQVMITVPLFAEDKTVGLQEPKVTLEEAIIIVKQKFEIPDHYREFTSGFSSYNDRQSWSLNWNSIGEKRENFSAQVDASTGEIVNMYTYSASNNDPSYKLPAISLEEAKGIADNKVKKLAGDKYNQLTFIESDNIIPLDLHGTPSFTFNWERVDNGIPVQGNGARMQIDANNGEVMSYSITWHNVNLPTMEKIIDAGQAAQGLTQNKTLNLQYFLAPKMRPLATENKDQVQLVYQLNNKNSLIDAFTGSPLKLKDHQYVAGNEYALGHGGYEMAMDEKAKSSSLTPQELQEIEKNTKLLTKEEALKVIQKWVEIPSELALRTMNLNTESGLRDTKVWYFEWSASDPERFQSITARVDAITGELIGFNSYSPHALDAIPEKNSSISKKDAQTLAEEFLKKIQPVKVKQVQLKEEPSEEAFPEPMIDTVSVLRPEQTSVNFKYERIVNGIVFPSNGMNVTVDLLTKKITAYSLNWFSLDFPPLSQAISQSKAEETFLASRPMVLEYVLIYDNGRVTEAKLVYLPSDKSNKVSDLMDAKTGAFLDWQGKPLNAQPHSYHFTDISGHEAEKEITVLGQAGVFGEYDHLFKPEENLTAASLFRGLLSIQNGTGYYNLTAEEILKHAKEQGWLKEEITPSEPITREQFSKFMVRYLGLEKIAELKDIYQPSFQDIDQSHGYIALATGLNIMKGNGQNFEPNKNITRAEAAYSIIKALGNKR